VPSLDFNAGVEGQLLARLETGRLTASLDEIAARIEAQKKVVERLDNGIPQQAEHLVIIFAAGEVGFTGSRPLGHLFLSGTRQKLGRLTTIN